MASVFMMASRRMPMPERPVPVHAIAGLEIRPAVESSRPVRQHARMPAVCTVHVAALVHVPHESVPVLLSHRSSLVLAGGR
jgi:hypothetical protein